MNASFHYGKFNHCFDYISFTSDCQNMFCLNALTASSLCTITNLSTVVLQKKHGCQSSLRSTRMIQKKQSCQSSVEGAKMVQKKHGYQSSHKGATTVYQGVCFIITSISCKCYIANSLGRDSIVHVRIGVRAVLLLLAGDVETNPGPPGKTR